jgi:site-specific DNA recombinase
MRAALYVRVSTQEQAKHGLSIDEQERALRARAKEEGWEVSGLYREAGVSGRRSDRPEYQRLLADAQRGRFEKLLVWKLDRFGRDTVERLTAQAMLRRIGVEIVSLKDPKHDPDAAFAPLIDALFAGMAEAESRLIGDRVRAAYPAMLRKRGSKPGGKRRYGRNRDRTINEREANVIRTLIVPEILSGRSEYAIVQRLNEDNLPSALGRKWNAGALAKMLRRPGLAGLVEIEGNLVEGSEEPILDRETWDTLQAFFAARDHGPERRGRGPVVPFLLDSPIAAICGHCGRPLMKVTGRIRQDGTRSASYVCPERRWRGPHADVPRPFPREAVDETVIGVFQRRILDEHATLREIERAARLLAQDTHRALATAERDAMSTEAALARVKQLFRAGDLTADEWRSERAEIEAERRAALAEVDRLRAKVEQIEGDDALFASQQALLGYVAQVRALAADLRTTRVATADVIAAVRMAISQVVEEVVIVDTSLPIHYVGSAKNVVSDDAKPGDTVGVLLDYHMTGYKQVGLELVARRDLAVPMSRKTDGRTYAGLEPGKSPLPVTENLTFTSQKTAVPRRRQSRSTSTPARRMLAPRIL